MDYQIIGEKHGINLSQLLELEPLGICLYRKFNISAWLGHSAQVFESNIILDISVNYRPETNSGRWQTFRKGRPGGEPLSWLTRNSLFMGLGAEPHHFLFYFLAKVLFHLSFPIIVT